MGGESLPDGPGAAVGRGYPAMSDKESAAASPAQRRLSRRRFIRLALWGGIGLSTAAVLKVTEPVGPYHFYRWMLRGAQVRRAGAPAVVALGRCASYRDDVLGCLREQWAAATMPDVAGKRVLVKPNLIDFIEGYPITTAPEVVVAVVDLLRELGAGEVAVGDGSGFRRETRPVAEAGGLAPRLAERRVPFIDLNYDDPAPVPARDGWFLHERELWLPRHVREADLIVSVPKMKTHHWAGVSLSLKNLFGVVPGARYGWPKNMLHVNGIPLSILGLHQSVAPVVAVVDGITGMEGDGPLFGQPVMHGVLAVGADAAAVDAVCMQAMDIPQVAGDHVRLAGWAGVGQVERLEVRGAAVDSVVRPYAAPPSMDAG